jgi:hypothetical protein
MRLQQKGDSSTSLLKVGGVLRPEHPACDKDASEVSMWDGVGGWYTL